MRLIRTTEITLAVILGVLLAPAPFPDDQDNAIHGKSIHEILACRKDEMCASKHNRFDLAEAISKPKNIDLLIDSYAEADEDQREVIVIALSYLRDPRVETFMRSIAFQHLKAHEPDYSPQWYPLQYLARACDDRALARLSRPENIMNAYPIGCMWWQETVKSFGDCNYRPAIPYLVEALSTACLNIDDNALEALKKFFPGVCENTSWPPATQQCYREVAQKHGYKTLRK